MTIIQKSITEMTEDDVRVAADKQATDVRARFVEQSEKIKEVVIKLKEMYMACARVDPTLMLTQNGQAINSLQFDICEHLQQARHRLLEGLGHIEVCIGTHTVLADQVKEGSLELHKSACETIKRVDAAFTPKGDSN